MADRKPDGHGGEASEGRYDFGRTEQRGFWHGIEGLLKTLPLADMSDVVTRSSRIGRAKLDTFLLRRERDQLLRELGRIVADEARAGRLNLPLSALDTWERLQGVEVRLAEELRDVAHAPAPVSFPGESVGAANPAATSTEVASTPPAEPATARGGKTIGRRKPRSTPAAGGKKRTAGRKAKPKATDGETEVKKTVGRRVRKKGTPDGSDGSTQ